MRAAKSMARAALPETILNHLTYPRLYRPGDLRGGPPVALVYGNCQAEALRRLLSSDPQIGRQYRWVRVPAVHEISHDQLRRLHHLLPSVKLFITQPVRDDYRDLPLGDQQLVKRLPGEAEVIRYPVLYDVGPYPFQVYVHLGGDPIATSAPITDYHDLRIMYAAHKGYTPERTLDWLLHQHLQPDYVREIAQESLNELARREVDQDLDCIAAHYIRANRTTSFHTINHPATHLLAHIAREVLLHLNLNTQFLKVPEGEYLGHLRAPREPNVFIPLGAAIGECSANGSTPAGEFTPRDVVATQLAFYRDRPHVLQAGLRAHQDRWDLMTPMWRT